MTQSTPDKEQPPKRHLTASEELAECLDRCCGFFPEVIVGKNTMINCCFCANGVAFQGNTERDQMLAMIEWNIQIRMDKMFAKIKVDGIMLEPCIKCGYCCTVRPCGHGEWDSKRKCCVHLTDPNELDQRFCGIYDKIYPIEKSYKYGFFDCGCSSSMLNTVRDNVENKLRRQQSE